MALECEILRKPSCMDGDLWHVGAGARGLWAADLRQNSHISLCICCIRLRILVPIYLYSHLKANILYLSLWVHYRRYKYFGEQFLLQVCTTRLSLSRMRPVCSPLFLSVLAALL